MKYLKYKKRQLNYLAALLCCKSAEIEFICENINSYYEKWIENKLDSSGKIRTFSDGTPKQRIIRPSFRRLKEIQRAIKINILSKIELPLNVQGGVKKKSNITNAKIHQGNKYKFCTDLQNFFPSVTFKQIYNMFLELGYSNHVSNILTKLTSIEFELPQGTPTSTAIANLVFLKIDKELIELAKVNQIKYTRYVDDLTFSSSKDFRFITVQIIEIIKANGFKISYRKTRYECNQTITGIKVFNNYIDAPEKIKMKAKGGTTEQNNNPYKLYLQRIRNSNKNMQR